MKKALIFILLLSVFGASSSFAANFVEMTSDDNYAIYVDVASLEKRDDYVVAWVQWIPRGTQLISYEETYKTPVEYTMEFTAYSLKGKQSKTLESIIYGPNGKLVNRYSNPFNLSQYQEVIPATYGENIYSFVMYNYCYNETNNVIKNAKVQYGNKLVHIDNKEFSFPNTIPDYIIRRAIMNEFYPAEQYFSDRIIWLFYSIEKESEAEKFLGISTTEDNVNWQYHFIKAGETLSDIAMQYSWLTAQEILKANSLQDANQLAPQQLIYIPNTAEHIDDTLKMVMANNARNALFAQANKIVQESNIQNVVWDKILWPVIVAIMASLIGFLMYHYIKKGIISNGILIEKKDSFEFIDMPNDNPTKETSIPKDTQ